MRIKVIALLQVFVLVACDPDPAKQVRIVDSTQALKNDSMYWQQNHRDATPRTVVAPPVILPKWKRENCDLLAEKSGRSDFYVTGPCTFAQTGNVECRSLADDMHVVVLRQSKNQSTVSVYVNVESYKGPGSYRDTQMFITYQEGTAWYYWGSDSVHITVTRGEKSVVLPRNELIAEPPNSGVLVVSGTLSCGASLDSAKAVNPRG